MFAYPVVKVGCGVDCTSSVLRRVAKEGQPLWPPWRLDVTIDGRFYSLKVLVVDAEVELHDIQQSPWPQDTTDVLD